MDDGGMLMKGIVMDRILPEEEGTSAANGLPDIDPVPTSLEWLQISCPTGGKVMRRGFKGRCVRRSWQNRCRAENCLR